MTGKVHFSAAVVCLYLAFHLDIVLRVKGEFTSLASLNLIRQLNDNISGNPINQRDAKSTSKN